VRIEHSRDLVFSYPWFQSIILDEQYSETLPFTGGSVMRSTRVTIMENLSGDTNRLQ
jgi:hypothetical protein